MTTLTNTETDGRYDFIIFPNGGRECTGKLPSTPALAESEYLPVIKTFTAEHQNLPAPTRFSALYRAVDGNVQVDIGDWQGELEIEEDAAPETVF